MQSRNRESPETQPIVSLVVLVLVCQSEDMAEFNRFSVHLIYSLICKGNGREAQHFISILGGTADYVKEIQVVTPIFKKLDWCIAIFGRKRPNQIGHWNRLLAAVAIVLST